MLEFSGVSKHRAMIEVQVLLAYSKMPIKFNFYAAKDRNTQRQLV